MILLIPRFRATRADRQWHDLSFCLALLPYNERSVKKLADNIACYHDKLPDQEVFQNFNQIVEKSRKCVKNEELVNDLEVKIRFCHSKGGGEDQEGPPTDEVLSQMKDLLIKPSQPKQTKARNTRKKKAESSEDEQLDGGNRTAIRFSKRNVGKPVKRRPPASTDESDDDLELPTIVQQSTESSLDEEEDFEVSSRASKRSASKKKPQRSKNKPTAISRKSRR